MRWVKPNVKGRKPCARYFHAVTTIGDAVIVVGGKDDHMRFNDVHVFNKDPKCAQWTQPHIRGTPPKQRSAHTVNVVGNKLYVFGGHRDGEKFNDVQVLDTSCMTWWAPKTSGHPPGKRNAHTATTVGCCIYVFGGFDGESCNDLHMLDTWSGEGSVTWSQPHCIGTPPSRRCCHSATLIDQAIWIFAGKNNDAEGVIDRFNDLYYLDTSATPHIWVDPNAKVAGTPPSKRNAHSACAVGRHLLIFGGFDGESCNDLFWFDTQRLVWQEISCASTSPSARYCHASIAYATPPAQPGGPPGHCVLAFGGCDADRNYADIQLLEMRGDEVPGLAAGGGAAAVPAAAAAAAAADAAQLAALSAENTRLKDQVEEQTTLIKMLRGEKDSLEDRIRQHHAAAPPRPNAAPPGGDGGGGGRRRRRRGRGGGGGAGGLSAADDDAREWGEEDGDDAPDAAPAAAAAPRPPPAPPREPDGAGGADGGLQHEGVDSDDDADGDSGRRRGGGRRRRKREKRGRRRGKSAAYDDDDDNDDEEEAGLSSLASGSSAQRPPARGAPKGTEGMNPLHMEELRRRESGGGGKQPNTVPGRLPALSGGSATGGGLLPSLNTDRPSMLGGGL